MLATRRVVNMECNRLYLLVTNEPRRGYPQLYVVGRLVINRGIYRRQYYE